MTLTPLNHLLTDEAESSGVLAPVHEEIWHCSPALSLYVIGQFSFSLQIIPEN
jgi:hypothetical protein